MQPGASVSSVAISHGINANVIRKWMRDQSTTSLPAFVQLKPAPKRPTEASATIELSMAGQSILSSPLSGSGKLGDMTSIPHPYQLNPGQLRAESAQLL